jgi:hypothetical protein
VSALASLLARCSLVAAVVGGIDAMLLPSVARAQALPPEWGPVWLFRYGAEDPPAWCLKLHDGGKAEFLGGFESLNPASWKRDPESGDLSLTLAALDDVMAANLQWQVDHPPHYPDSPYARSTGFDRSTRTVRYRITRETRFIQFGGAVIARPQEVAAENLLGMPASCGVSPPAVEPEAAR